MSEFLLQNWLDKTATIYGVFASGIRHSNKQCEVRSYHEAFPEAGMNGLLQSITEVAFNLRNNRLGGSRLRWVFENAQIHAARGPDGTMAVLVTINEPTITPAVEEMFLDFLATASMAGEVAE
jgi:hypothetical protein